jgi:hypothetical protein
MQTRRFFTMFTTAQQRSLSWNIILLEFLEEKLKLKSTGNTCIPNINTKL